VPLNKKGKKIIKSMKDQYGSKRGEQVFYASVNKGSIKGVEKMKNGGLGKRFGPPPKKGPDSQGLQVTKLRGGGMDMGNAASQAKSVSMAGSSSTTSSKGRDPSAQFKDSTPISSQARQDLATQRKTARETISPSTKASSQIAANIAGTAASMIIPGSGMLVKQGILNRMDAVPYWERGKKKEQKTTMPPIGNDRDGGGNNQPIIIPEQVTPTSIPIPRMTVQPKRFPFEYQSGGLVRGSGKVLKGRVKKTRIY